MPTMQGTRVRAVGRDLPVHHQLLESTQTHVHQVGDAIQPSHPLSSPSPLAPSPSQSREVPCSALKGETVPDRLPATPKSPPTRRVPPRGTPRVPAPLPLSPFSPPDRDRSIWRADPGRGLLWAMRRHPAGNAGSEELYKWGCCVRRLNCHTV